MNAWITITTDNLKDYLAAEQVEALAEEALADGQSDPAATALADVVNRIRTEIRGNPMNRVSATDGSIPPEMKSIACALAIEAAQTRLPGLALTTDQIRMADNARRYLARVASGNIPVSLPTDPELVESVQRNATVDCVTKRARQVSAARLNGL